MKYLKNQWSKYKNIVFDYFLIQNDSFYSEIINKYSRYDRLWYS